MNELLDLLCQVGPGIQVVGGQGEVGAEGAARLVVGVWVVGVDEVVECGVDRGGQVGEARFVVAVHGVGVGGPMRTREPGLGTPKAVVPAADSAAETWSMTVRSAVAVSLRATTT
ncbi:hypothetical protein [Streptomyces phaeochromogenes]